MNVDEVDSLIGESVIQQLNSTPLPLQGQQPKPHPIHNIKSESVRNRVVFELAATGKYNHREIAEMTGYSYPAVGNILRSTIGQSILPGLARANVESIDSQVSDIIKENVLVAVETCISVMNNPKSRDADRLAAAEKLLERRYGKANQPINRGTDVDLNSLPDSELIKMAQRQ